MPKFDLETIANLQNETSVVSTINVNFQMIEDALDEVLFREGTGAASDNALDTDLDMNSKRILNLPEPLTDFEPIRLIDGAPLVVRAEEAAIAAEAAQAAAETAETNAETAETNAEASETASQENLDNFLALYDKQYDISFFIAGTLNTDEMMFAITLSRKTRFPADLTDTIFKAGTNVASTETALDVQKNGVSIGSITFAVDTALATFTFATETVFEPGDTLQIVSPSTVDTALADISGTLRGFRMGADE